MISSKSTERNTKNALEWIVFGLSCLLVASAVGILAFHAILQKDEPADVKAVAGEIVRKDGFTIIPIKLTNHGSRTASEVKVGVEVEFPSGNKSAELAIDFVPRGGSREGFVVFGGEESPASIRPRVVGYVEP